MIQARIDVQKHEFIGGIVQSELVGITELEKGIGAMGPEKKNVIDILQPEAWLIENGVGDFQFKDVHEQISI